jgi:hypothetical protein
MAFPTQAVFPLYVALCAALQNEVTKVVINPDTLELTFKLPMDEAKQLALCEALSEALPAI